MIRIKLDKTTRQEIEYNHWKWFEEKYKHKPHKYYHKQVLEKMLCISENDLKTILIGHFDSTAFQNIFLKIKKRMLAVKKKKYYESWKTRIKSIFNYESFRDDVKWNSYKLFFKLGVNVCPYCNRQYIFTVKKDNEDGETFKRITAPEIDHFFPQTEYPYLACSLYNFVPSCHTCNHVKDELGEGIVYPYEEEFGKDFPFRVKFGKESSETKNLLDIKNAHVFFEKIKCKKTSSTNEECRICQRTPRIQASIRTFQLAKIYNKHKMDLADLFTRYRNYSNPKIDEITKLFIDGRLNTDDLRLNRKQRDVLYQKIAKTYTKRIRQTILGLPLDTKDKQYPLRKFKEDIIEQLDETAQKMRKEKT